MKRTADIIICGAGSAGVAAAYYLTKEQGVSDVLVVDQHPPLTQTSSKSGENYRNWWPSEVMAEFADHSIDLMEDLAGASGNIFHMDRRGYVYASSQQWSHDDMHRYLKPYRHPKVGSIRIHGTMPNGASEPYAPHAHQGYTHQPDGADVICDRDLIRQTFPHFSKKINMVIHARRCGAISAQQLGIHLLDEAKIRGARELRGEIVSIEQDGAGIKAVDVRTEKGKERVETRRLIIAAGPFLPQVAAMLHIQLPVFSVLQQKIAIQDPLGIVPREAPFTIFLDAQHIDWSDEEKALFQTETEYRWLLDKFPEGLHIKPEGGPDSPWIKLGWAFNRIREAPVWEPRATQEFPDLVLRGAATLVPGLRSYYDKIPKPVVHYGGYYTKTEENLPLIGPLDVRGAFVVGALSGFGTMVSCAAGELVAAWVTGGDLPDYAPALSPTRYHNPEYLSRIQDIRPEGEL